MPNPDNEPQIPKNQSPITDDRTGMVSRDWYRFFVNLLNKANSGGGGGGTGTVTSVSVSGGSTGLTTSGSPITTSGTIVLGGTLAVTSGGTGSTSSSGARTNLDVPSTGGVGATGTWSISVTGNAGTVTNGIYTTGSYADPTWITSIAGSKVSGNISGSAGSVANALTIGTGLSGTSYNGSSAVTIDNTGVLSLTGTASQVTVSASTGAITLSLPATINVNTSGNAGTVTNGVYTTGSYADPTWITSLAGSKISGNISGNAANVTGTVAVANGGTGLTSIAALSVPVANTANTYTTVTGTAGQSIRVNAGGTAWEAYTPASGTVTSVTGTSPVVSSGGATPAISLASGYGDTQNPYASKTANYFLAAPNGSAGVPTFRAIVAADVPTLNQNTTGTASNVTGVVAIANGGTGQTTKLAAFDALSPATTKGDLIAFDGTDNVRLPVGANGLVLQADSTQATGLKWASTATNTIGISNDTTTATNLYPTFASATTGSVSTIYTGNANLLYKPSTGELTSTAVTASNGIFLNNLSINTSTTIPAGYGGISKGPLSIASGVTVTVASGATWVTL